MKFLDLTFATPAENLACDEALLDLCEESGVEVLRFWESREPFVVLGYGNRFMTEVNVDECRRRGVPILRRCSGGGTVVQGAGCLSYNLTLRIVEGGPLSIVTQANRFIMERNRAAMEQSASVPVSVQGCTDMAFLKQEKQSAWCKFSGNAQRRRRGSLVFHGTLLYQFDLELISRLLRFPSAQPDYRSGRSHADFVGNIPVAADQIRRALRKVWHAEERASAPDETVIQQLVAERYGNDAWNLRRA